MELLRITTRKQIRKYLCLTIIAAIFAPAFSTALTSSRVSVPSPFVKYTLFLSNDSLIIGNPATSVGSQHSAYIEKLEQGATADGTVSTSVNVGAVPNGIAFDPTNGNLYVANFSPGTVSVINGSTNSIVETVNLNYPVSPWDVGFDPYNGNIYVGDTRSGSVSVISGDNNSVLANVAVGDDMLSGDHDDRPNGVVFDPYNDFMYVAMYGSGFLAEINSDTNALVANAPANYSPYVNRGAWGLAYDLLNCNLYSTNELADTLIVVSGVTNAFVTSINVGHSPNGVVVDDFPGPSHGNVFVTNYAANTVSVINGSSDLVINTINVGQNPDGIALDPRTGELYVSNFGDGTVSVIDGVTDSVVDTIKVGSGASGIAYDAWNGNMYVTNSNVGTVSVISTGQDSYSTSTASASLTNNSTCGAAIETSNATGTSLRYLVSQLRRRHLFPSQP